VQQQHREQRPRLSPAHAKLTPVLPDLERAQQPILDTGHDSASSVEA
jgi:hypothetical protein